MGVRVGYWNGTWDALACGPTPTHEMEIQALSLLEESFCVECVLRVHFFILVDVC